MISTVRSTIRNERSCTGCNLVETGVMCWIDVTLCISVLGCDGIITGGGDGDSECGGDDDDECNIEGLVGGYFIIGKLKHSEYIDMGLD